MSLGRPISVRPKEGSGRLPQKVEPSHFQAAPAPQSNLLPKVTDGKEYCEIV